MERRAKLLALACFGVLLLSSLAGLLWISIYAVK
jgi:hypothetical protein